MPKFRKTTRRTRNIRITEKGLRMLEEAAKPGYRFRPSAGPSPMAGKPRRRK
jgi:hypothetical protein